MSIFKVPTQEWSYLLLAVFCISTEKQRCIYTEEHSINFFLALEVGNLALNILTFQLRKNSEELIS